MLQHYIKCKYLFKKSTYKTVYDKQMDFHGSTIFTTVASLIRYHLTSS